MKSAVYVLALLILAVTISNAERCEPDICDRVRCANATPENCNGTIAKGACGCCTVCVQQKGEACDNPWTVCVKGTTCTYGICQ